MYKKNYSYRFYNSPFPQLALNVQYIYNVPYAKISLLTMFIRHNPGLCGNRTKVKIFKNINELIRSLVVSSNQFTPAQLFPP